MSSDDEEAVCALLLKKSNLPAEPNFQLQDPEVVAEPWVWLMGMVRLKAKKGDFQGLFGSPGPYVLAFQAALHACYADAATSAEQSELVRVFSRMGREYLTWSSSGRRASEFMADLHVFAEIVLQARTLLDEWDARKLAKISAESAKDFRRVAAITRLPLSRRAAALAMRRTTYNNHDNGTYKNTEEQALEEKAGEKVAAPAKDLPKVVPRNNRPNPSRRRASKKKPAAARKKK